MTFGFNFFFLSSTAGFGERPQTASVFICIFRLLFLLGHHHPHLFCFLRSFQSVFPCWPLSTALTPLLAGDSHLLAVLQTLCSQNMVRIFVYFWQQMGLECQILWFSSFSSLFLHLIGVHFNHSKWKISPIQHFFPPFLNRFQTFPCIFSQKEPHKVSVQWQNVM